MNKIFTLILMITTLSNAFAATNYNCTGMGQNVRGDANGNVWVNGQAHYVTGTTADGQGVVTECYLNTNGVVVYISLYPVSATSLKVSVYNAVTNGLVLTFLTNCTFSLSDKGKTERLYDQKHFSSLIKK